MLTKKRYVPGKAAIPPDRVQDYFRDNYKYDPDTGEVWRRAGGLNSAGYHVIEVSVGSRENRIRFSVGAHRLAFFLMTGEWLAEDQFVDHKNRKRDDNRWSNLRVCTHRQNAQNRTGWGEVPFRGVQRIPALRSRPFMAKIGTHPNTRIIGYFETANEAAKADREAAIELYGEFASIP